MLIIELPATDEFVGVKLQLEHSLVSLSKWEAIYEKPFYNKEPKTIEETREYIEQMLLVWPPPENFKERLTVEIINSCSQYIDSKQSATWFRETPEKGGSRETITSELIYHWMIQFQIPSEYQNWHINRLMTLIKICGIKQSKPTKMSKSAMAEQYRKLNAQRREQLGTNG